MSHCGTRIKLFKGGNMSIAITPSTLWNFPALRSFPVWDDDDDFDVVKSGSGGLTLSEDDKHVYVSASVPGVDPKKVEVTYHKGVVWIKGEVTEEESDKNKKFYRKASSTFSYRVAVPGDIDQKADPKAIVKNGIMTVTFTKIPQEQPKKISVKEE